MSVRLSAGRLNAAVVIFALVFSALQVAGMTDARAAGVVLSDDFTRSRPSGWGSPDSGPAWTHTGSTSNYRVSDGQGVMTVAPGATRRATSAINSANTEIRGTVSFGALPRTGTSYIRLAGRVSNTGSSAYAANVGVNSRGDVVLQHRRVVNGSASTRASTTVSGLRYTAGQQLNVRFQVIGSNPAVLRSKVWVGPVEPNPNNGWLLTTRDSSTSVPRSGRFYAESNASPGSTTMAARFDNLSVTDLAPAPTNQPPSASFTATPADGLSVSLNASGSRDPEGSPLTYAWDFGDGTTGTGVTNVHAYLRPGRYTVTLTVTDNAGVAATTSRSVSNVGTTTPKGNLPPVTQALLKPGDEIIENDVWIKNSGVYTGIRFNKIVRVQARNVTFVNCFFEGPSVAVPNRGLLMVEDTGVSTRPSATVERSTFIPAKPHPTINGIQGSNFIARNVEITDTVDGVHIYGQLGNKTTPYAGQVTVENSWIHDLHWFQAGPFPDGTHNDGVQIIGGKNINVLNSRIDGAIFNAAILATQGQQKVDGVTIRNTLLAGGSCTVNIDDIAGTSATTGLNITGNTFIKGTARRLDCAILVSEARTQYSATANVWHDNSLPRPVVYNKRNLPRWA